MTPHEEAVFEAKAEKEFRGHRELRNGRNFTCWNRDKDVQGDMNYRKNFDATFPNSPGVGL